MLCLCKKLRNGADVFVQNIEVAWILKELGDLLEFKGENIYKIKAYRKAARIVGKLPVSVVDLYNKGELVKVPGIGKNINAKIGEIIKNGSCELHRKLLEEIPRGLLEVMDLTGVGPKRARVMYEQLNIDSINALEEAAKNKQVRKLPGMGPKLERDILFYIMGRRSREGKFPLGIALGLAEELIGFLRNLTGVESVSCGGSLRRRREMVSDIDIIAASDEPKQVLGSFSRHPMIKKVLSLSQNRMEALTALRIPVDLTIVEVKRFWPALVWNTGSKAHLKKLQQFGGQQGFIINKSGLFEGKKFVVVQNEEQVYEKLGLAYIPPELREDCGEVEAAAGGKLPKLIDWPDIKGDLHVHTNWSDGTDSIKEIVDRARKLGYEYLAVTDHSRSLKIARGLSLEALKSQNEAIRRLNAGLDGFRVLTGIEVDILTDGSLDYPDEILKDIDVVVASVHRAFKQDRETMTVRVLNAVINKHVDILGHPTGRLLSQRDPFDIDMEKVIKVAAECGTALEINASPDRLDLNDKYARMAADYGAKIVINTDSHNSKCLNDMRYGVYVARRAWLQKENVINTYDVKKLLNCFKPNLR